MPHRSLVLGLLLILSGTVLAAQPSRFERISELASQSRFKEAAKGLHQIAEEGIEPGPWRGSFWGRRSRLRVRP